MDVYTGTLVVLLLGIVIAVVGGFIFSDLYKDFIEL